MVNLLSRLFDTQKSVIYKPGFEGASFISHRGILQIGDHAGGEQHIGNLLHEVAHFVEIDDKRCFENDWGLSSPQVPMTCQAIQREARVWGIQAHLCHAAGVEFLVREHAKLLQFLPGCYNLPNYDKAIDLVESWILDAKRQWSLDRILSEWDRKCAL